MIVVVTRLQAASLPRLRHVFATTGEVLATLQANPGFVGGRLRLDRRAAAWTMTGWRDEAALAVFREAHVPVMARVDELSTASATTAWRGEALPTWREVARRWTDVTPPAAGVGRRVAGAG